MDKFKITWKCGQCDILHEVVMEGNGVHNAVAGTIILIANVANADRPSVFQLIDSEWVDVTFEAMIDVIDFITGN